MPDVRKVSVVTQAVAGEITINLNLTISIDSEGNVRVEKKQEEESPDYEAQIPEFESVNLIDFGKEVK